MDTGRSPEKLQADKGTEFLNRNFQSFLKEKNIHFFTTNSELKVSVVERFNRTLKTRTWKYFTAKNNRVYTDILQDIVHGYNNSYHRSIGRAPASVSLLNMGQVRRKLYGNSWTKPGRKFKFKLGDQVRNSKSLAEIVYPHTWYNIREGKNSVEIYTPDNLYLVFKTAEYSIQPGDYEKVQDVIDALYKAGLNNLTDAVLLYDNTSKRVTVKCGNRVVVKLRGDIARMFGFPNDTTIRASDEKGFTVALPETGNQYFYVYTDII